MHATTFVGLALIAVALGSLSGRPVDITPIETPSVALVSETKAGQPTPVSGIAVVPAPETAPLPIAEQPRMETRRSCNGGTCSVQHVAVYSTGEYRWDGRRWQWHARPGKVQAKQLSESRPVIRAAVAPVRATAAVVRRLPIIRRLGR